MVVLPFVIFITLKDKVILVYRLALVRARTLINQILLVALGGVPTSQINAARGLEDHAQKLLIAVVIGVVIRISIADLYWTKKNLIIVRHLVLHHALGQGGIVALGTALLYFRSQNAASGKEDHADKTVIAVLLGLVIGIIIAEACSLALKRLLSLHLPLSVYPLVVIV